MTTKHETALTKVKYNKNEFETYALNLKAALRLHTNKLDTVMTKGTLNALIKQQYEDKLTNMTDKDGNPIYDRAEIDSRIDTLLAEAKSDVAATILLTLPDGTYKTRLERKHADDGAAMYAEMLKDHTRVAAGTPRVSTAVHWAIRPTT